MSEIKKLYELAGIENYSIKGWTGFVPNKYKIIADDDDNVIDIVLDFTAEKQLELIKLLAHKRNGFLLLAPTTDRNKFSTATDYYYGSFRTTVARLFKGIDETIAGLLNIIWQDLTEDEREQITEILRG